MKASTKFIFFQASRHFQFQARQLSVMPTRPSHSIDPFRLVTMPKGRAQYTPKRRSSTKDGSFPSAEQQHPFISQMERRQTNKMKKTKNRMKILRKLKCVAPGCTLPSSTRSTRRERLNEYSRHRQVHIEQAIDDALAKATISTESYSEEPSAVEFTSNEYERWKVHRTFDDALQVFSANWEVDVAQPMIKMESIQLERSISLQLPMELDTITTSTSTSDTSTIATTPSSSTTSTLVTIVEQHSSSSGTDKNKSTDMEDDFRIPTLLANPSQTKSNHTHIPESQIHLEQLLEGIAVMAHNDDSQKYALNSFHEIQFSSPETPLRSNTSLTEEYSLVQGNSRLSPLCSSDTITNQSVVRTHLQRSERFSDLIRRYEKLEQFMKADESTSLISTVVVNSSEETENEILAECKAECREETTLIQWTMSKQLRHEPSPTSVVMVEVIDPEKIVIQPRVTWEVENEDTRSKSQSSDGNMSQQNEEPAIYGATRQAKRNSSFKSRHGGWEPKHEDMSSNPSEDGTGSFGSASFSSFIDPVATHSPTPMLQQMPTVFHSPTPHPFFWRSHPRATFKSYDTKPVKLDISNARFASFYARDVILNPPDCSWQSAVPASSIDTLKPMDNDLEAAINAEVNFLVMNPKPPLLPKKTTRGRIQRFDPSHVRNFRKDKMEFPEIPPFSTNFGQGLEYTSSGDDPWTSSWDTSLSQRTDKI